MKRSRKSSRPGRSSKDAVLSTSSEGEGVKMNTRMSSGKRKADKDTKRSGWVESVYDADEDTTSDSSSQQHSDPYEFSFKDDIDVKAKMKKQPKKAQSRKATKKKGSNKMKSNATSTPVLNGQASDNTRVKHSNSPEKELLVTPEVTPILPIKPDDCNKGGLDDSCNTPTVRRSLRKRSLRLEEHLSSMVSFKSISSQGDSGIVVSPPLKKMKSPESFESNPHLQRDSPLATSEEKKQSVLHRKSVPDLDAASANLKTQKKRKVLVNKTENEVVKKCKNDTSCFGFESVSSVSVSVSDETAPKARTKKATKTAKHSYRSSKASNSSPDSLVKDMSECMDQENYQRFPTSPVLFSDSLFSDDGVEGVSKAPKPSSRSYTSLKVKSQKVQKQIAKLDSWANELNSQIADVEKFELIIE